MDIAAKAIQFRDDHRAALATGFVEGSSQLRATVERICALTRLDLNEHAN